MRGAAGVAAAFTALALDWAPLGSAGSVLLSACVVVASAINLDSVFVASSCELSVVFEASAAFGTGREDVVGG